MERIAIAIQDGGVGAGAQRGGGWRRRSGRAAWWRGPRANLIFVLPPNVYVGPPPGREDFLVSDFHPGPIPGNLA